MFKLISTMVLVQLMLFGTVSAEEILQSDLVSLKSELLGTKTYNVSGSFAPYDFTGVDKAFDWTFVTPSNDVYQLQGNAPTANDVFGWKQVYVSANNPSWYMSYLGDWDSDDIGKYDWILVGNGFDAVYKLEGVTAEGTFAYSEKIDVPYSVSTDKKSITFGSGQDPQCVGDQQPDNGLCFEGEFIDFSSVELPPGEIVSPKAGTIILRYDRDSNDDYIEVVGTEVSGVPSMPLTKVESVTDGIFFSAWFSNDKMTKLIYDDWEMDINENNQSDFTINERSIALSEKYLTRAAEQSDVDCSIGKTEYEELLEESGRRFNIYFDIVAEMIFGGVNDLYDNDEPGPFLQNLVALVLKTMPDVKSLVAIYVDAENAIENYADVCGGCGDYEHLIAGECVGYRSNYIPSQDQIDAVMADPVITCPWTRADENIRGCGYDANDELYIQATLDSNLQNHGIVYSFNSDKSISWYQQYNHGRLHGLVIGLNDSNDKSRITSIDVWENGERQIVINLNVDGTWRYSYYRSDLDYDLIGFDADGNLLWISRTIDRQKEFNATFANGEMIDCKLYENNQVSGNCMEE